MDRDSYSELVKEIRAIREEMQKQTQMFSNIAKSITDELRGIKNEVSR